MFWSFSTQWKPIEANDLNIKAPVHEKSKISPYCSFSVIQGPGRLGHPRDSDVNVTVVLMAKMSTALLLASSMFMWALEGLPNECMRLQNWQRPRGKTAFCQKQVSISRQVWAAAERAVQSNVTVSFYSFLVRCDAGTVMWTWWLESPSTQ